MIFVLYLSFVLYATCFSYHNNILFSTLGHFERCCRNKCIIIIILETLQMKLKAQISEIFEYLKLTDPLKSVVTSFWFFFALLQIFLHLWWNMSPVLWVMINEGIHSVFWALQTPIKVQWRSGLLTGEAIQCSRNHSWICLAVHLRAALEGRWELYGRKHLLHES